jgi:hypothetical protein
LIKRKGERIGVGDRDNDESSLQLEWTDCDLSLTSLGLLFDSVAGHSFATGTVSIHEICLAIDRLLFASTEDTTSGIVVADEADTTIAGDGLGDSKIGERLSGFMSTTASFASSASSSSLG